MSEDKPLHVRVAEALGCRPKWDRGLDWCCHCPQDENGDRPHFRRGDQECISRYDTDWSATGPLIEKYSGGGWIFVLQRDNGRDWSAHISDIGHLKPHVTLVGRGSTACVAVCNLILALSEAGKLSRG